MAAPTAEAVCAAIITLASLSWAEDANVVVYTRLSAGDEESYQRQVDRVRAHITQTGLTLLDDRFLEGHCHPSTGERALTQLCSLVDTLDARVFPPGTIVLASDLARFGRRHEAWRVKPSAEDWVGLDTVLTSIRAAGCHVMTIGGDFDTRRGDHVWDEIDEISKLLNMYSVMQGMSTQLNAALRAPNAQPTFQAIPATQLSAVQPRALPSWEPLAAFLSPSC